MLIVELSVRELEIENMAGKFPAARWTRILRPAQSAQADFILLYYFGILRLVK